MTPKIQRYQQRYAVVDNSTLTAVEQLLGRIPVHNRYALDGDISALESLVQGILFYDQLFSIDDYKPGHSEERHKYFDFIIPLSKGDVAYDSALNMARQLTADMAIRTQGSVIDDDDFRPFLEALRMNMVFTWRMRSSVFWLTVSMLGDPKGDEVHRYSKLWNAISSQLLTRDGGTAASTTLPAIGLIDKSGRRVSTEREDVDGTVRNFAASMGWLALRTAFYCTVAQLAGIDVVLHPIRHSFRLNLMHRHLGLADGTYAPIVSALDSRMKDVTRDVIEPTQPIVARMDLPLFSAYLAQRTTDIRDVLRRALDLRHLAPFDEARRSLTALEDIAAAKDRKRFVTEANRILRALDSTAARLRSEFGIATRQGVPISGIVAVANVALQPVGIAIPDVGISIPVPNWLQRRRDRYALSAVFRSIVEDLAAVERLGAIRTKLTSAANVTNAKYYRSPVENEEYYARDSSVRRWF